MGTAEFAIVLLFGIALMYGHSQVYRAERDYYRLKCEILSRAKLDPATVCALWLQAIPQALRFFRGSSATMIDPGPARDPRTTAEADRLLQMAREVVESA